MATWQTYRTRKDFTNDGTYRTNTGHLAPTVGGMLQPILPKGDVVGHHGSYAEGYWAGYAAGKYAGIRDCRKLQVACQGLVTDVLSKQAYQGGSPATSPEPERGVTNCSGAGKAPRRQRTLSRTRAVCGPGQLAKCELLGYPLDRDWETRISTSSIFQTLKYCKNEIRINVGEDYEDYINEDYEII